MRFLKAFSIFLVVGSAISPNQTHAQSPSYYTTKNFNCAAALQTIKKQFVLRPNLARATDFTVTQIERFRNSVLKVKNPIPHHQALYFNSETMKFTDKRRKEMAGRLSSIEEMAKSDQKTDLVFTGFILNGREDIQNYFGEMRKEALKYHETLYGNSAAEGSAARTAFVRQTDLIFLGSMLGVAAAVVHHDLGPLAGAGAEIIAYSLAAVSSQMRVFKDPYFLSRLDEIENFIGRDESGERFIVQSQQFKVLPETIQQAWRDEQVIETQLAQEHFYTPVGRVPFPVPRSVISPEPVQEVGIDYILESANDDPAQMTLTIFVRADHNRFDTPAPPEAEVENQWVKTPTSRGRAQPVYLPVRANNQRNQSQ